MSLACWPRYGTRLPDYTHLMCLLTHGCMSLLLSWRHCSLLKGQAQFSKEPVRSHVADIIDYFHLVRAQTASPHLLTGLAAAGTQALFTELTEHMSTAASSRQPDDGAVMVTDPAMGPGLYEDEAEAARASAVTSGSSDIGTDHLQFAANGTVEAYAALVHRVSRIGQSDCRVAHY